MGKSLAKVTQLAGGRVEMEPRSSPYSLSSLPLHPAVPILSC
jgi:hypothetical protein